MDPNDIPHDVKQILRNQDLTMSQKMVAFLAYMPVNKIPENHIDVVKENLKVGRDIALLIMNKKIEFTGFNSNFIVKFKHM
jgi:hypothetical protein